MKGEVTMKLDRSNIMQAVEDWLEKELAKRPIVTAIEQDQYKKEEFTVTFSHQTSPEGT